MPKRRGGTNKRSRSRGRGMQPAAAEAKEGSAAADANESSAAADAKEGSADEARLLWTPDEPKAPPAGYCTALLVWPKVYIRNEDERRDFQTRGFKDYFPDTKHEPVVIGNVITLPGQGGEGGRSDLFFWVHESDMPHFVCARFKYGIRWWQDVYCNNGEGIYPQQFRDAYPDEHWGR